MGWGGVVCGTHTVGSSVQNVMYVKLWSRMVWSHAVYGVVLHVVWCDVVCCDLFCLPVSVKITGSTITHVSLSIKPHSTFTTYTNRLAKYKNKKQNKNNTTHAGEV